MQAGTRSRSYPAVVGTGIRWTARLAAALLLLVPVCQTASAQGLPASRPIVRDIRIENEGAGHIDRSYVLSHLGQKIGTELDYALVSADVRKILKTGIVSDIRVSARELVDGVELILSVEKRLRLETPLKVAGSKHFREGKIRDWIGLEPGDYVDDAVLGDRVRKVVQEYRDDKYASVEVSWEIDETDHQHGLGAVTVFVDEGSKARVKKTHFEGNAQISDEALKQVLEHQAWWNPLGWFGGRKYDIDEIEMGRDAIRRHYIAQGYLDASVGTPRVAPIKKGKLAVTYVVDEGNRYSVSDVTLDGVELFDPEQIERLLVIAPGSPALRETLMVSIKRIRDRYGREGYAGTSVRPVLTPDALARKVAVHLEVTEGSLTRVRHIHIRGNTRTRDKVIRRELLVRPGDLYNSVKIQRSERIVQNLGFFSRVQSFDETTPDAALRDLVMEVEEKRTGQFMMGAGFSSVDNLVGFLELSQGNFDLTGWPYFTGGGQKLRTRLQFGTTRRRFDVSFVEPWFLDRRLSLGVDLYRSDSDYDDYSLERTGGAVSIGRALPGPNRINYRYQLENVRQYDVADTNEYTHLDATLDPYYFTEDSDVTSSSLRITVTHDTRDNPFVPSRGNRVNIFGELAGGPLGFDTDTYRLGIQSRHYIPLWFGHVLSFRGSFEMVDEYGDTEEMPISDRLFLGGGRTIRGFEYREVGPKVGREVPTDNGSYVYHRPYGGRSMVLGGVEYTIPLLSKFRAATFCDAGNAWRNAFDVDLSDLAVTAGVGIRIDMPGFPIRIDRAWVLRRDDPLSEEDPWVFWIGYDF